MPIWIISSAPIQYEIAPYDLFDSFDLVSQGKLQAPLAPTARTTVHNTEFPFDGPSILKIFTGPVGQTLDTARLLVSEGICPNATIVPTYAADGIRFSMTQLVSKEAFELSYETSIKVARMNFLIKFINDELLEPKESVLKRMAELLSLIQHSEEKCLCISHGFYMKLLEIHFKSPHTFDNLDELLEAFEPEKRPYGPLEGFKLQI
jgi:broad specificity phosphatase PhoE